jgi:transcriptional regulator GlxA family with amidase domain
MARNSALTQARWNTCAHASALEHLRAVLGNRHGAVAAEQRGHVDREARIAHPAGEARHMRADARHLRHDDDSRAAAGHMHGLRRVDQRHLPVGEILERVVLLHAAIGHWRSPCLTRPGLSRARRRASVEIDLVQGYLATMRVIVFALPGGMASSLAITLDALATANGICRGAGRRAPFVVRELKITRTARQRFAAGDLVILPGLGTATEAKLTAGLASPAVRRAIRLVMAARAAGATIAASCASTFLLAEAGLLNGRRATTTWWLAPAFRRRYPAVELVTEQIVVADWPVATAGAAMAQMDLMLALIAKFAGARIAEACARYLLLDHRRSQAPYMAITFLAGQDERIARAESWLRRNIAREVAMDELAAVAGLTPRTFARRLKNVCGLSPVRFAQRIRGEAAVMLLETTRLSVDEIARRVGYAEPSTLRRLLRRETSRSPSGLRRAA